MGGYRKKAHKGVQAGGVEGYPWYAEAKAVDELLLHQSPLSDKETVLLTSLFSMEYTRQYKHGLKQQTNDNDQSTWLLGVLDKVVGTLDVVVTRSVNSLSKSQGLNREEQVVLECYAAYMRTLARNTYDQNRR